MTAHLQKRLAIGGVVVFIAFVLAANARLLVAAIGAQPACVATHSAPAKHVC